MSACINTSIIIHLSIHALAMQYIASHCIIELDQICTVVLYTLHCIKKYPSAISWIGNIDKSRHNTDSLPK